jgi:small basic protein (TIGR04137 family)
MTIHKSLAAQGKLARTRNVFTRMERLEALKKSGKWKSGDSVFGLTKVRTRFKPKVRKTAPTAEEKAAEAKA